MSIPADSSLVQYISNNIILFLVVYTHQNLSYERLSIHLSVFVVFVQFLRFFYSCTRY